MDLASLRRLLIATSITTTPMKLITANAANRVRTITVAVRWLLRLFISKSSKMSLIIKFDKWS